MKTLKKTIEYLKNYEGTNYQVGQQIGQWVLNQPQLLQKILLPPNAYPENKLHEIEILLNQYCSGINEEIQGFADTLKIKQNQVLFYAMTYLERGCSLMALLPSKTKENHTVMARNYDFNDDMEEMCFAYTNITGKHKYLASTLNLFGRCDGMNEHGLAVCKASIGLPVGNFEGGQKAEVTGFSFWVVVRSLLENCKTVQEALEWTMSAPIGYNMNLMLADQYQISLLECTNGHKSFTTLDSVFVKRDKEFLSATNHIVLPELTRYESMQIENSVIRNNNIISNLEKHDKISKEELKNLLTRSYPEGLCCHYYPEFFGTLRSMIFDINDKTINIVFGSPQKNGWHNFPIDRLSEQEISVNLPIEKANDSFYRITQN